MINVSLIILFAIVIILIILFVVLSMTGMNNWAQERETIVIPTTRDCVIPLDELIVIDTTQNICCYNNGALTGAYYVQTESNGIELAFSTIPVATYYTNVCRQYCSSGYTINDNGTLQCEGETDIGPETTLANDCVDLIRPEIDGVVCRGSALPIAARGITPYYALNAETSLGIAQCPVIGPCPL